MRIHRTLFSITCGLSLISCAQAAPPTPPEPVADFGGAQPLNKKEWFLVSDYPATAVAAHHQGNVGVSFAIGTDGRVSACRIVRSSGYPELDSITCPSLERRARFKPAVDANNRPKATVGKISVPFRMWP